MSTQNCALKDTFRVVLELHKTYLDKEETGTAAESDSALAAFNQGVRMYDLMLDTVDRQYKELTRVRTALSRVKDILKGLEGL